MDVFSLEWQQMFLGEGGLIHIGEIIFKENITEKGVYRELRKAGYEGPEHLKAAYLEPDGEMSFLSKKSEKV